MAITYGFYNSMNGDRKYDAAQLSSIFDGVIRDGVFQSIGGYLATKPGTGMQVIVSPGKAWFDHTWTVNDADLPLGISPSDLTLSRYDAVVLETDATKAVRENSIKVIKGTPASDPKKPTLTNEGDVHQHPLAYILVPGGSTEIQVQNIDIMVGKAECPFVTSILESVSIEALLEKWEGEFRVWFDELQNQMAGDVATNLQNQITRNAPSIGDIVISFDSNRTGPWLKCNGQIYDKEQYPDLYQKLKGSCSFEKEIPAIPGYESVMFVGEKGFFFKDDTFYVSDSLWTGPVKEHSFSVNDVFSGMYNLDPRFYFANGYYFMILGGSGYINSKYYARFAYSSNGYEWERKDLLFEDQNYNVSITGILYHRSMYAIIYMKSNNVYISYMPDFKEGTIPTGTLVGYATIPVTYMSEDGNTIYIIDYRAESTSQHWKIGQDGVPHSFTMHAQGTSAEWIQLYELNGTLYKIYYWPDGGRITWFLSKEGESGTVSSFNTHFSDGYDIKGLDISKSGETVYVFTGKSVLAINNEKISNITDNFVFHVGTSNPYLDEERRSLNARFLIADWTKSTIFSSQYKEISASGLSVVDDGVRTNSPEITPYIESAQGFAYIRSEK